MLETSLSKPVNLRAETLLSTAALLALVGGFLDGFTYVGHGHVFANAMTGNVVLLGIYGFSRDWEHSLRHLPPIVAFVLGIAAARTLSLPEIARRVRDPHKIALGIQFAILLFISWLPASTPDFWITVGIAFAASLQLEYFREVNGRKYNSTFTTGNLRTLAESLFDLFFDQGKDDAAQAARDFALICLAFLCGAGLGGFFTAKFQNKALWIDLGLLAIAMIKLHIQKNDATLGTA
jgi:uncharacterized membrane protein YoaK (UPF0700 family)